MPTLQRASPAPRVAVLLRPDNIGEERGTRECRVKQKFGIDSRFRALEHGEGGRMEAALHDGAAVFCKVTFVFGI